MGTSKTPAELLAKVDKFANVLPNATREGVHSGAAATKQIILSVAASRGVSPGSKIATGKWSVGYDVRGKYRPTALVQVRGAFHLVESDTKLHVIGAKRLGTRAQFRGRTGEIALSGGGVKFGRFSPTTTKSGRPRAGKRALVINGSTRAYAVHPGTKGKRIFETAKNRAERVVPPIIRSRVKIAMGNIFQ